MAANTSSPFMPPASLIAHAEVVATECENMEVRGSQEAFVFPLQMAALLFIGDLESAKHVWRRNELHPSRRSLMEPWARVLDGMLNWNLMAVWNAIQTIADAGDAQNATYANEVANAYRVRLTPRELVSSINIERDAPKYAELLRMDETAVRTFLEERKLATVPLTNVEDSTAILTFLESSMNQPVS